jgi:hypothetical protein
MPRDDMIVRFEPSGEAAETIGWTCIGDGSLITSVCSSHEGRPRSSTNHHHRWRGTVLETLGTTSIRAGTAKAHFEGTDLGPPLAVCRTTARPWSSST